jgi:hypothetical protein
MAKDNSNANGDDSSADVHLVLNGKGGVGKSLVATWLAEFLISRGRSIRCIDGDPVNRSLSQYKALGAERLDLVNEDGPIQRGIPHDPERHGAYVSSWINVLKQDKNEIFRAAHDASRAADFLLALERDRSIASEMLKAGLRARPDAIERATAILEPGRKERDKGTAPAVARSSGKMTLRKKQGAGPMTLISVNHCLRRMKSAFSEGPPYLD